MKTCASRCPRMALLIALLLWAVLPNAPGQAADTRAVEAEYLARAGQSAEQHRKGDALLSFKDSKGQPMANTPVQIRQTGHEFLFGCIAFELVRGRDLPNADLWKQRFSELFNFAVFPFYWASYERQPGTTPRDETLAAVKWCQERGITTKGHPLVWTDQAGTPKWLQELSAEQSEQRMLARVTREVSGFAGAIDIWDVVNEPTHCPAWKRIGAKPPAPRVEEEVIDYIDKAFRTAHQANPKAHLILNEYFVIARQPDRERFYQLVVELKRRGTPLSGLGIQAHEPREEWFSPEKVRTTLDRLGEFGYPLHITEYIPQSGGKPITGGWREGTWTEEAQAEFAEQFYRLCFGHPAVVSINWWGLSDGQIWLPGGGLLRADYEPKPVYMRLKDLIHRQWRTSLDAKTDEKGQVSFRGFYGTYGIALTTNDGRQHSYQIALRKGGQNQWEFTVAWASRP